MPYMYVTPQFYERRCAIQTEIVVHVDYRTQLIKIVFNHLYMLYVSDVHLYMYSLSSVTKV